MKRTLIITLLLFVLVGCTPGGDVNPTPSVTGATATAPTGDRGPLLLVGSCWEGGRILRFEASTGRHVDQFADDGELDCAEGDGIIGPDGVLYVTNWNPGRIDRYRGSRDSILKYDARTGDFLGVFVEPSGELDGPHGLAFGPDGNLYVTTRFTDSVLRYDGRTGEYMGAFVKAGTGGLNDADRVVFRPDGMMYVVSLESASILRYDAKSGEFIDEFVKRGSGGLSRPHDLVFTDDGDLLVSSFPNNSVLRYDGRTGEFEGAFVEPKSSPLEYVGKMAFGPDGAFYATSCINNMVLKYDSNRGAFTNPLVESGSGGLSGATFMLFVD
jgi:DNA-binding beta-propeller fold protein YncE